MSSKEVRDMILNNRSIRKQILITPVDSKHLEMVADHTGLSQNEIINKGLSAYLARYKKLFAKREEELKEAFNSSETHADTNSLLKPMRIEGSSMLEAPSEE